MANLHKHHTDTISCYFSLTKAFQALYDYFLWWLSMSLASSESLWKWCELFWRYSSVTLYTAHGGLKKCFWHRSKLKTQINQITIFQIYHKVLLTRLGLSVWHTLDIQVGYLSEVNKLPLKCNANWQNWPQWLSQYSFNPNNALISELLVMAQLVFISLASYHLTGKPWREQIECCVKGTMPFNCFLCFPAEVWAVHLAAHIQWGDFTMRGKRLKLNEV